MTTDSGDKFFEFNADGHEAAEANNTARTQFVIPGANLMVTSFNVPGDLLIGDPAQAEVNWTVTNQGPAAPNVSQWIDRVVFSADPSIGNADDMVLADFVHTNGLEPGESYTQTQTVTLPANRTGQFFLYVVTDAVNSVIEPDGEKNNASDLQAIEVTVPYADLVVEAVGAPADDVLDADDVELARVQRSGVLAPEANYTGQTTVKLPHGIDGPFHVFVETDFNNAVFEFVHDDNNIGRTLTPVTVTLRPSPNLVVTSVSAPDEGQPQQNVVVDWTVENTGPGVAEDDWIDHLYFSPDGSLNGAILLATASQTGGLKSGASYTVSRTVSLPTVAEGSYFFVVVADATNQVFEGDDEDDNLLVSDPIQIGHADLAAAITTAPDRAVSGSVIPFQWTVTNLGTAPALGTWVDRVFLSSDALLSADDRLLAERTHAGPLTAASDYTEQIELTLPADMIGDRFLILVTDAGNSVFEPGAKANNTANRPIAIELGTYAEQVDAGIVGEDGLARTTSPPFSGINTSGRYFAGSGVQEFVGERLASARAAAANISGAFVTIGGPGGAILAAPLGMLATQFVDAYFEYLVGSYELKIYSVPKEGLPQVTTTQVELAAGRVNEVVVTVPSTLPAEGAWSPPAITTARFEFADAGGGLRSQLVLEGERFTYDNPLAPADKRDGSQFEDARVHFSVPGSNQPIQLQAVSGGESELVIDLSEDQSRAITLGLAEISVVRPQYLRGDGSWSDLVHKQSNAVRVQQTLHHAFAALGGNEVAVIDARLLGTGDEGLNLVARIPLSGGPTRAVTVTPDLTRAYVTQRFSGAVSVIDTATLQEIDTVPDDPESPESLGVNPIKLPPDAGPFWITVDPRGLYIYVSDEVQGSVHAIDTNPGSPHYHTVQRINVAPAFSGLRGLDVSADGKRLYVAAPGETLFSKPPGVPEMGNILVINTEVDSDQFFKQFWVVPDVGREPYGVTASNDPGLISFTNRLQDAQGFGALKADGLATSWTVSYVGLNLGASGDSFDVNNGQAIAVTSDLKWAFVTGYNKFIPGLPSHDPYFDPLQPGGSTVGVIRDPFNLEGASQLVAATRPIPIGFADNLVLTPDDRHLFVAYQGLPRSVFVYDAQEIINQIEAPANAHLLDRGPINDLVNGERTHNALIDIRADYRLLSINLGFVEFGVPDHDPDNGIINTLAAIATGGSARPGDGLRPAGAGPGRKLGAHAHLYLGKAARL